MYGASRQRGSPPGYVPDLYSLVYVSPHTPKMVVLNGSPVGLELLCEVLSYVHILLAFLKKKQLNKALNYISKSWSFATIYIYSKFSPCNIMVTLSSYFNEADQNAVPTYFSDMFFRPAS